MSRPLTDEAARQLATLERIARIAVEDFEPEPLLARIVDALATEFDWDFVACVGIDHERGEFVCRAVRSRVPTEITVGYRRALGSGVVGECAATGRTIDLDDTRGYPGFVDTLGGTRSELCVPAIHDGRVLAVLNAESPRPGAFRGQRALFETVAALVAGVLNAAALLERLQLANRRLEEMNKALEATARVDALTGVGNRRRFDHWLAEAGTVASASGLPMAVLMIDVDHFKAFNDGYGHLAGDDCLRRVARSLEAGVAGTPLRLARYGGEEFAAVGVGLDVGAAAAIAERLRATIADACHEHRHAPEGCLTVSIGVAIGVPGPAGPEGLTAAADAAMYTAKAAGRNRVEIAG